ncbi:16S rRNA (uracil(1498)-N(3))-methyltransferase [Roseospira marina]|uniref:Ribosomal RNA small subunit methyltransferase E n=1 Tax=Roseospira marina TaxID=140057 RepID=A0A5M6I9Q5_9PROT|nr:16S rRNA (uracil(1498)-N(3))-methyltransferase [Roseospira marina]KAA5605016.1 16S rRNA (uracil(1498)-N(3))-methyltransferase [Roseospira marina]MBB4314973.1 16S rRNA (uracil1498-N3)-methyltransferase [Roseospira marina]MBB5087973.1 16S rRNA (uracil1498-N3)-methyltransferase [Roseospira marina]
MAPNDTDDDTVPGADLSATLDALAPAPPCGHGPRLFVADPTLDDGAVVTLEAPQAHYLRSVMRRGPGDSVVLFNGRDGEWQATLETMAKAFATARCAIRLRPQSAEGTENGGVDGPWLLFAPLKRGPVDLLAEKATELGVARLQPVMTRFTTAARVNATRLRANAIEAAEQCRRLSVPEVAEPITLARIPEGWPEDRHLFVLAEHGHAVTAASAFAAARDAGTPAALLVGPEGGFADSELDALCQLPFVTPVRLGPRVLRAETAAIAGLTLWQALAGDWR